MPSTLTYSGRSRHLFALLALLVLVLSVDVLGFLGVGDPKESSTIAAPPSKVAAWNALNENARQMLDKEHEAVVAEIRLRIEQEHLLFALKFGLVGAILWAFLQTAVRSAEAHFERTPFAALAAWSAVVAGAIVDLRVTVNQTFLATLGGWSRQYEHLTLAGSDVSLGWEAFLADNLLSKPYYPALRVSGQILTALLFCVTAFVFLSLEGNSDRNTARINGAGAIVSISLMTLAATTIRRDTLAILIYVGAGVTAAIVAAFLSHSSHANEPAAGA